MHKKSVIVVGAGIGGLSCALTLSARGTPVTVLEAAAEPGGRMRETFPDGRPVDSGPTVLTLAPIFEELFAQTGERLTDHLRLEALDVLARHAWSADERLDLHADRARSRDAIAAFAGEREAAGFDRFCRDAQGLYQGLEQTFMRAQRPGLLEFAAKLGPLEAFRLRAGQPFASLWGALGRYFRDPRLRQLFGRYATYVGSSPFAAPAVLMLIAEVEMHGVHAVRGGMAQLARALADLAVRRGVRFEYGERVSRMLLEGGRVRGVETDKGNVYRADAVVFNGDPAALGEGQLGPSASTAVPEASRAASLGQDPLAKQLAALSDKADTIRKKIVATKEGGAITGEERIREKTSQLYGAVVFYEGRPADYYLTRIDSLSHERQDVVDEFDSFIAKDLTPVNKALVSKKMTPITPVSREAWEKASVEAEGGTPAGGNLFERYRFNWR